MFTKLTILIKVETFIAYLKNELQLESSDKYNYLLYLKRLFIGYKAGFNIT